MAAAKPDQETFDDRVIFDHKPPTLLPPRIAGLGGFRWTVKCIPCYANAYTRAERSYQRSLKKAYTTLTTPSAMTFRYGTPPFTGHDAVRGLKTNE
jgi:hypothetical protein